MFPPCYLTSAKLWRRSNEDNGDLLQKVPACTATLSAPNPAAGHRDPRLSWTLLGKSESVSCGSLLPSPGSWCAQVSVCASRSLFPQSCVSSGSFMVGLMVTSPKRAYAIPKSGTPRAPSLWQSTADPYLHRRHSNTVLAQSLWGLWVLVHTKFV